MLLNTCKKLFIPVLVSFVLACKAAPHAATPVSSPGDLLPDEQQSVVLKTVGEMVSRYNYKKVELNDSISMVIYKRYLKALDGNHTYFLASDVKSFEPYQTMLDDDIKTGNLEHVFTMFNTYKKRYNEHINYALSQIDKNFDYKQNDRFVFDRDSLPFIASQQEMDNQWTERVKYDMLNLKLASADIAKNKETLKKRYTNLLTQSGKLAGNDVLQIFMDALTNAIDPHTNYFNPANAATFNIDMARSLEGIGATLGLENEYITIKALTPGGPAIKSHQVEIGDRILAVAQGANGEFQDIIGWRSDNAVTLIRGAKGTVVRLKLLAKGKSASDQPKVVELVREKIILQDQSVKKEIRTYKQNGKTVQIGIIHVPAFYLDFAAYKAGDPKYKSTTRDVKLILDTLKRDSVAGVVMDLRQNGGGSLVEAISLTGLFIKSGPVVQVRDTRNHVEIDADQDSSISWAGPMAVVVDRFSASASEIFAGAIQDYGRGLIVGTQTYGKGTVQQVYNLDQVISPSVKDMLAAITNKTAVKTGGNNSKFGQLNLTIAKFYRISGGSTQHKGVTPDVTFPAIIPLDKYGEDTEPSALPYDMINASTYTKVGDFSSVLPQLQKLHDVRAASNPSYRYLAEDIADYKKREVEKSTTLNEELLKQRRDADEARLLERNNLRRVALGLQPLKKGEAKPKNEELDFLKIEAGQILTDYIGLEKGN